MTHTAFLGVGAMGLGMSGQLARAGRRVVAFDLSQAALEKAREAGCETASSAPDAIAGAAVVITMLQTGAQVRQVYADTVLKAASPGALVIDCSTVDVDTARHVASQAAGAGLRAADAPVSGGIAAAAAGTLTFMVGCGDEVFEAVRAELEPMAKTIVHAGASGAGQAAKICNNMVLGVSMIGVCEAFALAEKLGLAPERFFEIASKSSGQCWSLTSYCPWPGLVETAPSNRGYEGGFLSSLMLKDLTLAQEAAAKLGSPATMGSAAQAFYSLVQRLGYGGKDFSSVLQLLRGAAEDLAPK
jgi:3-hydroxyisobutyrate dehydrogenase